MTSYVWQSGNGVFISPANWSPAGVPGSGDTATISGGVVVTDPNDLELAGLTLGGNTSLTLSDGGGITSSLVVAAGAVLSDDSISNYLDLDGVSGSIALATVSSGGVIYADDLSILVGSTGGAVLSVAAGGVVSAVQKLDLGISAGGSGTVLISGGKVAYGTDLYVGNTSGGIGSITVEAGGSLEGTAPPGGTSGYALIGANAGASGTITVNGSGAVFNTDGNPLVVGLGGEGSLVVAGGAQVETGTTIPDTTSIYPALGVGDHSGGVGSVTVGGSGSVLRANGIVGIGRDGDGELTVTSSGMLIGGALQANVEIGGADATGSTGQDSGVATVASGGTLSAIGDLLIGTYGGMGELFVSGGGNVLANAQVGIGNGNATYNAGFGTVIVGPNGELAAGVAAGGVPTGSSGIYLGGYAGAVGSLTVSGAGR